MSEHRTTRRRTLVLGGGAGAGGPALEVESGNAEKVSELPRLVEADAPSISSLIYLSEQTDDSPETYESKAMTIEEFFIWSLAHYNDSASARSDLIRIGKKAQFESWTGDNSLAIGGDIIGTENVALGLGSRAFDGFAIALGAGAVAYNGGISIGRLTSPGAFTFRNIMIGGGTGTAGFADADDNVSIADLYNGNQDTWMAGIHTRDFSDLTEAGSMVLLGELRTMAPIASAAGNWRFGTYSGGNLIVTVDGVDYEWAATPV